MSKGDETRERIIAKAAALFNQRGLEGTSLADLMEATGIEKGGIYRHFPSKEAVAVEAFDYAWHRALESRMHDLDTISNSVDKLKKFVANFVERQSPLPGGCPLLNSAIDSDDGNVAMRERTQRALRQWRERLGSIVRTGIKNQEISSHVDPKSVATLAISSLEGALMISRLNRDREALRVVQAHLKQYLDIAYCGCPKDRLGFPQVHGSRKQIEPTKIGKHRIAVPPRSGFHLAPVLLPADSPTNPDCFASRYTAPVW